MIGHRGASGYRPEHTLAAYELAARMGADYLEPDLVRTRDGVLVCRHEPEITHTTDVAARFPDRDPVVEGFTLEELKTLRARERIPELRPDNARFDGEFEIPAFQEVIDLAARLTGELGRPIGVYPETKHPEHFRSLGLALEPELVRVLRANGLDGPGSPVFVQSFEAQSLRELRGELRVPLVQLVATGEPDLPGIAGYAHAVGPAKGRVDAAFVRDAHAAGLDVHPWTFRRENAFLPEELRSSEDPAGIGDARAEYERFFSLGIDGVFSDNPDLAVEALAG